MTSRFTTRRPRLLAGAALVVATGAALGLGGMQMANAGVQAKAPAAVEGKAPAAAQAAGTRQAAPRTATVSQTDRDWEEWAACLRAAGVKDFPTLRTLHSVPGKEARALWTEARKSPAWKKATAACADRAGAPNPGDGHGVG
jgi:hypothetical protein